MTEKQLKSLLEEILDVLRYLSHSPTARIDAVQWLAHFERRLKGRRGIKSLTHGDKQNQSHL